MKIPTLTKSCVLASILVLGASTIVNAAHEKDGSPSSGGYDSREYPGTPPGTQGTPGTQGMDYGTSGDSQERRYTERRRTGSEYDRSDQYNTDDPYDDTGNEGTGPRLKGRY